VKTYLKSYAVFLAMIAVTKLIVVPQAKAMNIPLVKDL
jgi:hypothetical protein